MAATFVRVAEPPQVATLAGVEVIRLIHACGSLVLFVERWRLSYALFYVVLKKMLLLYDRYAKRVLNFLSLSLRYSLYAR